MSGDESDAAGDDGDGPDDHGYRRVAVDEVTNTPNPTRAMRELDEAVGASPFECNWFWRTPLR